MSKVCVGYPNLFMVINYIRKTQLLSEFLSLSFDIMEFDVS